MSAPTLTEPSTARAGAPGNPFVGTGSLLRFLLRRDRIRLPAWAATFGLFIAYLTAALPGIAETEEDLAGSTQVFQEPVGRMLSGPGYGLDAPTYERFVAAGYGLYLLLLAALMSIFLVVRHTRVEEQTGRAELVRANVVGRHASLSATMVMALLTNLVAGAMVFLTMVTLGGWGAGGSLLLSAGIAAVGMAFAGVAAVTVQLSEYSRGAVGMACAVLGLAFLLRAGGDMASEEGSALSWLSPLGWGQQTAPFVLDRWWPLLLVLGLAVATLAAGFALSTRRDLRASLVAVRPGHREAAPSLGTPLGLAFRLQRGNMVGWSVGLAISGLAFGGFAQGLLDAADDLPETFTDIFGEADLLNGYLAFLGLLMALLAAAYAVSAVQGLRGEETSGRGEPVLAAPVGRTTWLGAHLLVIAAGATAMLVVAGALGGIGAAVVTGDGHHVGDVILAHVNQAPAMWVVVGLAALLFGLLPRAVAVPWVLVGFGAFMSLFGGLLEMPQALLGLSPWDHPAELPVEDFSVVPVLLLTVLAAAFVAGGLVGYRRRDLDLP